MPKLKIVVVLETEVPADLGDLTIYRTVEAAENAAAEKVLEVLPGEVDSHFAFEITSTEKTHG